MSVIKLKDGSVETIKTVRDFSDLLENKLGIEVRDWFETYLVNKSSEEVEQIKSEVSDILYNLNSIVDDLGSIVKE